MRAGVSVVNNFAAMNFATATPRRLIWLYMRQFIHTIGAFGLTEPDHGSDPGGMETKVGASAHHCILCVARGCAYIQDVAPHVVWIRAQEYVRTVV